MSIEYLTLLFQIDNPEQAEAIHALRAAFQGATDLEPVTPDLWAVHIYPGCCSCMVEDSGEDAA